MNKRMILAIAALLVFGLSVAAFAYKQATNANNTAMSPSCCKGDSCPMKHKDASTGETASCCDDCCCKGGDSCPMKNKGETSATGMKMADGASCPMMKKEKAQTVSFDKANVVIATDGESCCCPCCSKNKERKDAPSV